MIPYLTNYFMTKKCASTMSPVFIFLQDDWISAQDLTQKVLRSIRSSPIHFPSPGVRRACVIASNSFRPRQPCFQTKGSSTQSDQLIREKHVFILRERRNLTGLKAVIKLCPVSLKSGEPRLCFFLNTVK